METEKEGRRQTGKDGDRQGKMEKERERWRQGGKDGDRQGRMETGTEGVLGSEEGVSAEPWLPFVVVGAEVKIDSGS